jgi:hypothetical protein
MLYLTVSGLLENYFLLLLAGESSFNILLQFVGHDHRSVDVVNDDETDSGFQEKYVEIFYRQANKLGR